MPWTPSSLDRAIHEASRIVVDGREAIRIVSDVDDRPLVVDAQTYEPIEWTFTSDEGIRSTTRIEIYESLMATEKSLALTSVSPQHPDATVEPGITITNETGPEPKLKLLGPAL